MIRDIPEGFDGSVRPSVFSELTERVNQLQSTVIEMSMMMQKNMDRVFGPEPKQINEIERASNRNEREASGLEMLRAALGRLDGQLSSLHVEISRSNVL